MRADRLLSCIVGIALVLGAQGQTSAEMFQHTGLVPHARIPAAVVADAIVRLDVPHMRQLPYLCVPTSSAMILRYFGEQHDPVVLKRLAEEHKPPEKRNSRFTYWVDMRHALRQKGKIWHIRDYAKTEGGYQQGLAEMKRSLRAGNPVMIDVHLDGGHTFVVMGYNDRENVAYIRDPNIAEAQSRILPYDELLRSWHNHRFANSRSVFYAQR